MAPSCLIVIETEIWPELWHQCIKRSIPIFLISARVSPKAYQRYLRVRFFLASVLGGLTFLAANSHQDLERLISLGAPPERSEVLGSPKFDLLIEKAKNNLEALNKGVSFKTIFFNDLIDDNLNNDPDFLVKLNKLFASQVDSRPLILAGSTHQEEEKLIIETIKALSPRQFRLVIAPRHLQRVSEVALLAYKLNLRASLLSEVLDRKDPWAQRDTLIIDRLGLLTALYARCDIAIVGGSFFSGEGHNPIEPALWGRPIIFGPHTSSFEEIAEGLVTAGAALRSSPEGLREALLEFLDTPERAFKATSAGLKFVSNLRPIAPLLAKAVLLRLNKGS
jgi:3-deoxy-D-manno-octulosonic-acid transferase